MQVSMKIFFIPVLSAMLSATYGGYIIENDLCEIPDLPAFDNQFKPLENYPYIPCNTTELLSYINVQGDVATLYIKENLVMEQAAECCYSYVRRRTTPEWPDRGVPWFSPCYILDSPAILQENTVKVICYKKAESYLEVIYENVHEVIKTLENFAPTSGGQNGVKPISVLFIVIDSISRLNFVRTMPKTRNYILQNNFTEFKGYNKIDDNTLPNFGAWLTGMNRSLVYSVCKPTTPEGLDDCPMIWKDFENLGYVTAYAEDWSPLNTFNYNLFKGFKHNPTTSYFKHYFEATNLLQQRLQDYGMPFCSGPESEGERTLNLARDFTKTFKGKPNFGVFWMNTFSHNSINASARMDEKVEEFFQELNRNGILETSVVVLLSDHGVRYGSIIKTTRGFFEERLPMNYISLPNWFRAKFPKETKNFERNSLKLTSTYDLFITLQHILVLSGLNHTTRQSLTCPTCLSLFEDIPEARSCVHAGIPEKWCSCTGDWQEVEEEHEFSSEFWQKFTESLTKPGGVYSTIPMPGIKEIKAFKSKTLKNVFVNAGTQSYFLVFIKYEDSIQFLVILRQNEEIIHLQQRFTD